MCKQVQKVLPVIATPKELNLWLNQTQHLTSKQRFKMRLRVVQLLHRQTLDRSIQHTI